MRCARAVPLGALPATEVELNGILFILQSHSFRAHAKYRRALSPLSWIMKRVSYNVSAAGTVFASLDAWEAVYSSFSVKTPELSGANAFLSIWNLAPARQRVSSDSPSPRIIESLRSKRVRCLSPRQRISCIHPTFSVRRSTFFEK